MRIQSVQSYKTLNKSKSNNNYSSLTNTNLLNNKNNSNPSFGVMGVPLGGWEDTNSYHYEWDKDKTRILERSPEDLEKLAEMVHEESDALIKGMSQSYYKWIEREKSFLGFEYTKDEKILDTSRCEEAYKKISDAVKKVVDKKFKMTQEVNALEQKKGLGLGNATEQTDRINRQFLSLLNAEKEGKSPEITNGIIVYGTSKEKDKFIDDFTKKSGSFIKKFTHDSKKPLDTIDFIVETAKNAEAAFQYGKTRTILIIDKLDEMLTNKNNFEGIMTIGKFKGFVEHLSKDYHTTLVTKTDLPLEKFEEASIADHRFGIQVDLKEGISTAELKKLKDINEWLDSIKHGRGWIMDNLMHMVRS